MSVYLDASLLVHLLEDTNESAAHYVTTVKAPLLVSSFAIGEVGSVISRQVRTGELGVDDGRRLLAEFDDWCDAATEQIATDAIDVRAAARLVREFERQIKLPDAIHLVSASRRQAVLATYDRKLAIAGERYGVEVVRPS